MNLCPFANLGDFANLDGCFPTNQHFLVQVQFDNTFHPTTGSSTRTKIHKHNKNRWKYKCMGKYFRLLHCLKV